MIKFIAPIRFAEFTDMYDFHVNMMQMHLCTNQVAIIEMVKFTVLINVSKLKVTYSYYNVKLGFIDNTFFRFPTDKTYVHQIQDTIKRGDCGFFIYTCLKRVSQKSPETLY